MNGKRVDVISTVTVEFSVCAECCASEAIFSLGPGSLVRRFVLEGGICHASERACSSPLFLRSSSRSPHFLVHCLQSVRNSTRFTLAPIRRLV